MPAVNSVLFSREPSWFSIPQLARTPDPATASWLYETGSLTERLRRSVGGSLSVSLLLNRRQKPFLTESQLLHLPRQRFCLIREVLLQACGRPLILARTVVPAHTLKGPHGNLSRLGARPLGEVIFSYPSLRRRILSITEAQPALWSERLQARIPITRPVWGRRTVYEIAGRPLIVNEFFLAAALRAEQLC